MKNPVGIYMLKVNNGNTRTRCEICSKLTIKTPERRHWRRFGVFIVNFEQVNVDWERDWDFRIEMEITIKFVGKYVKNNTWRLLGP